MKAGKAVYCEKPMVRLIDEGAAVIAAEKETGAVFQVGSQYASSLIYEKVRELIASGAIGPINSVEARYNRNSPIGAWQYSIPLDATPQTVDWDRFLGSAPKRPFDPVRFFRWRNYSDYGTAVAGDLFVHLLTGIHHAVGSLGPTRIAGMGGQRYWKDGRDVYDFIMGLMDYPTTDKHPSFTLALQCNFEDGGGGDEMFRFVGSDGVINVSFTQLTLHRTGIVQPSTQRRAQGVQLGCHVRRAPCRRRWRRSCRSNQPPAAAGQEPRLARKVLGSQGLRRAAGPLRQFLHLGAGEEARLRERHLRTPRRGTRSPVQR